MSVDRANMIWKSPDDGLWRRGFYSYYTVGDPASEDFDPEWDVEYDYDSFWWTSGPFNTVEQADRSWNGPNPGGVEIVTTADGGRELDHLWTMHRDPEYAAQWTKDNHRKFIDAEHAKLYEAGIGDRLRDGIFVGIKVTDKLNPGCSVTGYAGQLRKDGDWLVMPTGRKPVKVYNSRTGRFYRHGWNATTGVDVHMYRPTRRYW